MTKTYNFTIAKERIIKGILVATCLLLLFAGILFLGATHTNAATSGTSGTCNWVIDNNGVLTISPMSGGGCLHHTHLETLHGIVIIHRLQKLL